MSRSMTIGTAYVQLIAGSVHNFCCKKNNNIQFAVNLETISYEAWKNDMQHYYDLYNGYNWLFIM